MRDTGPVTQKEVRFDGLGELVSKTDLNGKIQYANDAFIEICGYSRDELIGSDHNIVRHPDMPPAAFKDLWQTIKAGKNWRGMVKNRCKNGDHYWVNAFVSPVVKEGEIVGYQSVRSEPSRDEVTDAEKLYQTLRQDPSRPLPNAPLLQRIQLRWFFHLCCGLVLMLCTLGMGLALNQGQPYLVGMLAAVLLITVGMTWTVQTRVIGAIKDTSEALKHLASGNLVSGDEPVRHDELGELNDNYRMVKARFGAIIGQVVENTQVLLAHADHLAARGRSVQDNMSTQSSQITHVASAMTQMSATIEQVAQNMNRTADIISVTQGRASDGADVVGRATTSMTAFIDELEQTISQIQASAEESQKITKVTQTISEIAEQTNLLALNAAIEAARAGEQGRGFAVVADEVRNLAQRTQAATCDIKAMLEGLQTGIHHSSERVLSNNQMAQETLAVVAESRAVLADIFEKVNQVKSMGSEVATAAGEQANVTKDMSESVEQINGQSHTASEQATQTADIAAQLMSQSLYLKDTLNDFKLAGQVGDKRPAKV
ncbi:methyl-accepting chemotaxis protein [Salinivibrio kushneri]|uniref:PAS domain-containing methyl-accepting chemotaxis protein n=1 Tax=Salinivibrio kushneri TaxID=1908198 RepID=A0AA47KK74_9GAMM|nr:PAS domain-containing methyl-accepting chemotaxis protein [Salinivibrio kushneri]WBA08496.1 PAS domain-containing methyl-accepting chemotaxis protein [Salinivibrio kushneri]